MEKVWIFINSRIFLYIIIFLLVLFGFKQCDSYRNERLDNIKKNQNIEALKDTIRLERTKNGQLQASISGFISTIDELERLNKDLYDEVMQQDGEILSLNRIVFGLEQDKEMLQDKLNELESIMGDPVFVNDSTFSVYWTLRYDWDDNNFDIFKGNTFISTNIRPGFTLYDFENMSIEELILINHIRTEMVNRVSQIELTFGQKVENDMLRVFVQTNYPGFTPKSLEGVLIDPNTSPYMRQLMRNRGWFPNTFTVGVGPSIGYDFFNSKPYLGVGVNLNYNIYQW